MIDLNFLFAYFDELFPNAHCELNYSTDYELLIAIMLSSQTTDKAVNKATTLLFKHFPTLDDLKNASIYDIEKDIKFLGMSSKKVKNIHEIASLLCEKYNYVVPKDRDILLTFPGVGNKTRNCFLAEMYHLPYLAIDTHVNRISKRLNLVKESDDPLTIEKKLQKILPQDNMIKINHQFILFGRNICKAVSPKCETCKLTNSCKYFISKNNVSR